MTWPTKKLGEVLAKNGIIPAKIKRDDYRQSGKYPVVDQGENLIAGYIDDEQKLYRGDLPVIVFGDHTRIVKYIDFPFAFGADGIKILKPQEILLPKFFYYTLILNPVENQGYKRHLSLLTRIKLPIPPVQIQKQIVGQMDKIAEAQKLNDELIQKSDELFQSLLHKELDPAGKRWGQKKLKDLIENIKIGPFGSALKIAELLENGPVRVLFIENVVNNEFDWLKEKYISEEKYRELIVYTVQPDDILMTMMGTIGRTCITPKNIERAIISSHLIKITPDQAKVTPDFLNFSLRGNPFVTRQILRKAKGAIMKGLNSAILKNLDIPTPLIEIQQQIVAKLSAVQEYKKLLLEQKAKLKELFDSVLYRSMRGELEKLHV